MRPNPDKSVTHSDQCQNRKEKEISEWGKKKKKGSCLSP